MLAEQDTTPITEIWVIDTELVTCVFHGQGFSTLRALLSGEGIHQLTGRPFTGI